MRACVRACVRARARARACACVCVTICYLPQLENGYSGSVAFWFNRNTSGFSNLWTIDPTAFGPTLLVHYFYRTVQMRDCVHHIPFSPNVMGNICFWRAGRRLNEIA